MTRVSIGIPTYNRAEFLDETIESLLAQDWPDLEILVVDDGSTDDTPAVLERWSRKSPAVVVHRQANAGEASASNFAWRHASGDLFGIVCSDDPQPRELVRTSVDFLRQHDDVIVSYPDWWMLDASGRRTREMRVREFSVVRLITLVDCFVGPGAIIRRDRVFRDLPQLRDPRFRYVSDYSSWLALSLLGNFRRLPQTVAAWRDHPSGATSSSNKQARADEHVLLFQSFFARPDLPPEVMTLREAAMAGVHAVAAGIGGTEDRWWWLRRRMGEMRHLTASQIVTRARQRARRSLR